MPRIKKVVEVTDENVDTKSAIKGEATVTYRNGSRTYTKAIHGDNFRELAEEFAAKRGGTVA